MTGPVLEGRGLRKVHRRGAETIVAVDGLSIELLPGELVLIQGPSGSGKTSLLDLLTGFEAPDVGELLWQGRAVDPSALGWCDLAVVPQRPTLLDELTVAENVMLPIRLAGHGADGVGSLLDRLALGELGERRPGELSQGQAQRAELARAVAIGPTLLVADEPSSSQNEALARTVFGALRTLVDGARTALVASHDPVAVEYADRVIRLRDGRITDDQP